jgi:hypothetical protein
MQRSRDGSVGTVAGYGLNDRRAGVRVPVVPSPRRPDRLWDPPYLISNGYQELFHLGVKRPGRDADHSPRTSAVIKKMWIYTSTPPYVFTA